jgi:hypothetical protein
LILAPRPNSAQVRVACPFNELPDVNMVIRRDDNGTDGQGRLRRDQVPDPPACAAFPAGHSPAVAALLALSEERDKSLSLRLQAFRDGYAAALSDAVVASLLRIWPDPGHVTELEKRRYGPGGREHFGDPRPGDYPGQARREAASHD